MARRPSGRRTSAASSAACATPRSATCSATAPGPRGRDPRPGRGRVLRPGTTAGEVEEIDPGARPFVHEIEIGDLDGDGVLEVYATPSARTSSTAASSRRGHALRAGRQKAGPRGGRPTWATATPRRSWSSDMDGDGTDELYVSVEAVSGGQVEIRRYQADTGPTAGDVIATLDDQLPLPHRRRRRRRRHAGDGGRRQGAASGCCAAGRRPREWTDRRPSTTDSEGFEHAALLTDLDGDGTRRALRRVRRRQGNPSLRLERRRGRSARSSTGGRTD